MKIGKVLHLKNPQRRNLDLQDQFGLHIETALLAKCNAFKCPIARRFARPNTQSAENPDQCL